jgi:predicted nucleic acid-binding protein
MGVVDRLAGRRTYLDANIFIYAAEGYPPFLTELTQLFTAINDGRLPAVTSELTLAEVLVKPVQAKDQRAIELYEELISAHGALAVQPVSRAVLAESAGIRANSRLRLPDAVHVATSLLARCDLFLTNDNRIPSNLGIEILPLSDAIT